METILDDALVDVSTVKINQALPVEERIRDYIRQIKNPYCYLDHGVVVKIRFAGKRTFDDCLKMAFSAEADTKE